MRLIWPGDGAGELDETAVLDLIGSEHRPAWPDRPWVFANMVVSLDGATHRDGASAGLSGPGDRLVFHALRSVPDAIIVGSGTVRAERYGPVRHSELARAARQAREQHEPARLVIVSASLDLPADLPLFDGPPPLIATTEAARPTHPERHAALSSRAEILAVGSDHVDLGSLMAALAERGVATALVEGGPTLNRHLVEADLLDELDVTISPLLAGQAGPGLLGGARPGGSSGVEAAPETAPLPHQNAGELVLERVLEDRGALLCRYVVARSSP